MQHNDGMTSEDIFDAHWSRYGKTVFNYAFTDTRKLRGAGGKGFTNTRPSDRIVVSCGLTFWAEVKSTTDAKKFAFSNIQPAQWAAAKKVTAAGGSYSFFIHCLATDEWYWVPATVVLNSKKKHLKFSELGSYQWSPNLAEKAA